LGEKLGRPASLIHEPVPQYTRVLSQRVDTLLDRLVPGKLLWRRNFSLWPSLLLWAPCPVLDPSLWDESPPGNGPPALWLRTERQTLRRLPETGAIVFTIRVQNAPLSILAQRPDRARDLAVWLRAPTGATRRLQLGSRFDGLLVWLDHLCAAGEP
jgi:hypothetical protein